MANSKVVFPRVASDICNQRWGGLFEKKGVGGRLCTYNNVETLLWQKTQANERGGGSNPHMASFFAETSVPPPPEACFGEWDTTPCGTKEESFHCACTMLYLSDPLSEKASKLTPFQLSPKK